MAINIFSDWLTRLLSAIFPAITVEAVGYFVRSVLITLLLLIITAGFSLLGQIQAAFSAAHGFADVYAALSVFAVVKTVVDAALPVFGGVLISVKKKLGGEDTK